jgi:hypothetical protein
MYRLALESLGRDPSVQRGCRAPLLLSTTLPRARGNSTGRKSLVERGESVPQRTITLNNMPCRPRAVPFPNNVRINNPSSPRPSAPSALQNIFSIGPMRLAACRPDRTSVDSIAPTSRPVAATTGGRVLLECAADPRTLLVRSSRVARLVVFHETAVSCQRKSFFQLPLRPKLPYAF